MSDTLDNAYIELLSELVMGAQGIGHRPLRESVRDAWLAITNERPTEAILDAILDGLEA